MESLNNSAPPAIRWLYVLLNEKSKPEKDKIYLKRRGFSKAHVSSHVYKKKKKNSHSIIHNLLFFKKINFFYLYNVKFLS